MNVQELIDELNKIEDKTKTVQIHVNYGMGCWTKSFDIDVSEHDVEDDGDDHVCLWGDEDQSDSD